MMHLSVNNLSTCLPFLRLRHFGYPLVVAAILLQFQTSSAQVDQHVMDRISPAMKFLATMENQFNPMDNKVESDKPFAIEHFEIPLKLVENFLDENVDQTIKNSLVFEKDGQTWIRWIPNPDDTMYKPQFLKLLADHKISIDPQNRFLAFRTASRSILIFDPITGAEFSVKASTNQTRGVWKDKGHNGLAAKFSKKVSDYMSAILPRFDSKYVDSIKLAKEVGGFSLLGANVDQAMSIRTYPFSKGKFFVPLFSLMHEEFGKKIALANGYQDPVLFLTEKIYPLWTKSVIQFSFTTGFMNNSGHGQNFLLEVDRNLKISGSILHRDYVGDHIGARVNADIVERNGGAKELVDTIRHNGGATAEVFKGEKTVAVMNFAPAYYVRYNSWYPTTAEGNANIVRQIDLLFKNEVTRLFGDRAEVDVSMHGSYGVFFIPKDGFYQTNMMMTARLYNTDPKTGDWIPFLDFPKPKAPRCMSVFSN